MQRLLWEVGGALAFGPPTVDQFRNAHTLLHDFLDELDLYNRTGPLVQLLHGWKPAPGADLPGMMVDLAQTMAGAGMWAQVGPSVMCDAAAVRSPANPCGCATTAEHVQQLFSRAQRLLAICASRASCCKVGTR